MYLVILYEGGNMSQLNYAFSKPFRQQKMRNKPKLNCLLDGTRTHFLACAALEGSVVQFSSVTGNSTASEPLQTMGKDHAMPALLAPSQS